MSNSKPNSNPATLSPPNRQARCFAIIPAAGVGKRMAANRPKQYLEIGGKSIMQHTLERLQACPQIDALVLALSPEDEYFSNQAFNLDKVQCCEGGVERADSVLNALESIASKAHDNDWVMVHDVARPCIVPSDIAKLFTAAQDHADGALLAVRVRDTMKRTDTDKHISETVERDQLWHAYTPQMFPYALLRKALRQALGDPTKRSLITDEASAVEHLGLKPLLVEGRSDNIKVTQSQDLILAEFYLQQQAREGVYGEVTCA